MAARAGTLMDRLLGRETPADATPSAAPGPDTSASDLAKIKSQAAAARGRRGRPGAEVKPDIDPELLDKLFATENWEVIGSMYFDLRFAMTGFDYFKLTEKQERVLGTTMGAAMQVLLKIDPRYIALFVFLTNFGMFATEKELAFYHAKQVDKARRAGVENNGRQV